LQIKSKSISNTTKLDGALALLQSERFHPYGVFNQILWKTRLLLRCWERNA